MLDTDKMKIMRRRMEDKMRKDQTFLIAVCAMAIEKGNIKHRDILNFKDVHILLDAPMPQR